MIRPVGQAVKTPPFHGGNSSSILLRVTKNKKRENIVLSFLFFLIRPLTRIQVNGAKRKPCLYRFPKTDADLIDNFPPFTVEQRRCLCSVRSSATGHQNKKENARVHPNKDVMQASRLRAKEGAQNSKRVLCFFSIYNSIYLDILCY